MDNPCKQCKYMDPQFLDNFEYGCENPCVEAKEFYDKLGKRMDELIIKLKKLMNENNQKEN